MMQIPGVKGVWKRERSGGRGPGRDKAGAARRPKILSLRISMHRDIYFLEHPLLDEASTRWSEGQRNCGEVIQFARFCRVKLMMRLFMEARLIGPARAGTNAQVKLACQWLEDRQLLNEANEVCDALFKQLVDGTAQPLPSPYHPPVDHQSVTLQITNLTRRILRLEDRLDALQARLELTGPASPKKEPAVPTVDPDAYTGDPGRVSEATTLEELQAELAAEKVSAGL